MGSTRIKGNALSLTFAGTDFWADLTSLTLTSADADSSALSFSDVAGSASATDFSFKGTAIQSTQTSSFWRYAWANAGQTIAYRYSPAGNLTASTDQPHFIGTVRVTGMPDIGGDAGVNNDQTFDFEWAIIGKPTLDTGSDGTATISSIAPTGKGAGQQIVIGGTRLTGTTDIKFGTVSAASFYAVSDTALAVVLPTGAAGVKAVTVINPAGTSAAVNYTVAS